MPERELTRPYSLVGSDGRLNEEAVGWSRVPLCDATLPGPRGRRKRWNYWSFVSPELAFTVSVVDVDYLRVVFAHLLSLSDLKWRAGRLTLPFVGRPQMGGRVQDDVVFVRGSKRVEMRQRAGGVDVLVHWPGFAGSDLRAELRVEPLPGQESINVTIPWTSKHCHFTSKQPALPASGTVRVGDSIYTLGPPDSFAALDFARGVWRYDSTWNWVSASGRDKRGRVVGLNLGAGWTDGTPMTENGVVVDGVAHKIDRAVGFHYDSRDLMRPWIIRADAQRPVDAPEAPVVDLEVTPFYHHRLNVDLVVIRSKLDQVFGRVRGTVALPGETLELDGLIATCEEQKARW